MKEGTFELLKRNYMQTRLLTAVLLLLFQALGTRAQSLPETMPPERDSFMVDLKATNSWYDNQGSNYVFPMREARYSFGSPSIPDSFYVVPGEDILDNALLSEVLQRANLSTVRPVDTVYDTTWFAYDGYPFERRAKYVCQFRQIASVDMDGEVFTNKPLYRVYEKSTIWKHNDPNITAPWVDETYYYAFTDTGTHVTTAFIYWQSMVMVEAFQDSTLIGTLLGGGYNRAKFLQNGQTGNGAYMNSVCISLNPVPANSFITVTFKDKVDKERTLLRIADPQGRLVRETTLTAGDLKDAQSYTIDVSDLSPGFYLITSYSTQGAGYGKFTIVR